MCGRCKAKYAGQDQRNSYYWYNSCLFFREAYIIPFYLNTNRKNEITQNRKTIELNQEKESLLFLDPMAERPFEKRLIVTITVIGLLISYIERSETLVLTEY
jgi:hypothetical protein